MSVQQGFVLLSDADTDAPETPAVCSVSLDESWDTGGYALGAAAAARGALFIDRPYVTGHPAVAWLAERADQATAAGGDAQLGNEQNLALEGWTGGAHEWFQYVDQVRGAAASPERLLEMPPSPGVPHWETWVRNVGHHALHCYGSFAQMRAVVDWYLVHTEGDLFVTECNPGAGTAFDLDQWAHVELVPFLDWCNAQGRVRSVCYIAWVWDQSPTLPASIDARGTAVEAVIRDWRPPMNGGSETLFSIDAVRDQVWQLAGQLEVNGWAWYGQGLKALTSLSKGER